MTKWVSHLPDTSSVLLAVLVFPYFVVAGVLIYYSDARSILVITKWFDSIFFQYSLVLLMLAVLIVPFITYFYIHIMKHEKKRRLKQEILQISSQEWADKEEQIHSMIESQFRFQNFFGKVMAMMLVITLGFSALLLLKPMQSTNFDPEKGLDYSKGANILMLGPFIKDYDESKPQNTYRRLIISLTAFSFGFLGAYIYFISQMVRSYFTLDLTPNIFVFSIVRMVTASILALVLSFVLDVIIPSTVKGKNDEIFFSYLPVLGFFIGYFPSRGLLLLEKLGTRIFKIQETYNSTPLSRLSGMSSSHEVRLEREGFDNIENLIHADVVDLTIRTGFGYRQLNQWISQAWLRYHFGSDYEDFEKCTGITSRQELRDFLHTWKKEKHEEQAVDYLAACVGDKIIGKIHVICGFLSYENESHFSS